MMKNGVKKVKVFLIVTLIWLSLAFLVILYFALKSKKTMRLLLLNTLLGFAVFTAINLTTKYTGMHLPINGWTAAGTAVYGAPAVVCFLFIQILFP